MTVFYFAEYFKNFFVFLLLMQISNLSLSRTVVKSGQTTRLPLKQRRPIQRSRAHHQRRLRRIVRRPSSKANVCRFNGLKLNWQSWSSCSQPFRSNISDDNGPPPRQPSPTAADNRALQRQRSAGETECPPLAPHSAALFFHRQKRFRLRHTARTASRALPPSLVQKRDSLSAEVHTVRTPTSLSTQPHTLRAAPPAEKKAGLSLRPLKTRRKEVESSPPTTLNTLDFWTNSLQRKVERKERLFWTSACVCISSTRPLSLRATVHNETITFNGRNKQKTTKKKQKWANSISSGKKPSSSKAKSGYVYISFLLNSICTVALSFTFKITMVIKTSTTNSLGAACQIFLCIFFYRMFLLFQLELSAANFRYFWCFFITNDLCSISPSPPKTPKTIYTTKCLLQCLLSPFSTSSHVINSLKNTLNECGIYSFMFA